MGHYVERMLARRYLKARRGFISLTTWFAIIGIALGVATLILVTSLMNGIREDMTQRFIGIEGHAAVYKPNLFFDDYATIAQEVSQIEGVASVTAKVEGQVMATHQGRSLGAQVVAMPWDAIGQRKLFIDALKQGSWDSFAEGEGVVIGHRLARSLNLMVGDSITLISPQGQATIAGFIPRMKAYRVVGLLDFGMHLYDGSLVMMPFDQAQIYFKLVGVDDQNGVSNLEIMTKDVDSANAVARAIGAKLGGAFYVSDWQQNNAGVFQALLVQRNVMVIILALIILVAAFNIISSLVMLVKEKRRDIAILRTMGAPRGMIMRMFIMSGMWIGIVGTISGTVLGLILAANIERIKQLVEAIIGQEILVADIYFLSTLPTKTDPVEVIVVVCVSLVIALLATIYPARKAASLDPAEVLRDV